MIMKKSAGDVTASHSAISKSIAEPLRKGYEGSISQSEAQGKQLIELLPHGKALKAAKQQLRELEGQQNLYV